MRARARRRGATLVEFLIVAPLLILFAVTLAQYALLLLAQSDMAYATLMAARAGSTGNASPSIIRQAYVRAMIPWYGGGTDTASLSASYLRAQRDLVGHLLIQIISPQPGSYQQWNDPRLERGEGGGHKVIPWAGPGPQAAQPSGADAQTLGQARVLKLRIAQSIATVDPVFTNLYLGLLRLADPHTRDAAGRFYTAQLAQGRLVLVSGAAIQMQSDAIE